MQSTVTVVIPTFNRAHFLGSALDSVMEQTRSVDAIVVVDDGSTDGTVDLVRRYGSRVQYVRQENLGPAAARNRGIRESGTDYIAFLDSDDLWLPHKVAVQLNFFERHPQLEFTFADMANFDEEKFHSQAEIKNHVLHDHLAAHAADVQDLFHWLLHENVIPTPTVMCRRSALEKVGFFDEGLRIAEDYDFWLRAAQVCRWGFINEVLLHRRRHGSNLVADPIRRDIALLQVLQETARRTPNLERRDEIVIKRKTSGIQYDLGSALLQQRHYQQAYQRLGKVRFGGATLAKAVVKICIARLLYQITVKRPSVR